MLIDLDAVVGRIWKTTEEPILDHRFTKEVREQVFKQRVRTILEEVLDE